MNVNPWDKLRAKYPYIIGDLAIECNTGWYNLIDDLCQTLERVAPGTKATQIKEKYGGLRFYSDSTTDEGWEVIESYEDKSYHICEICGADGQERPGGWISTLCDYHYNQKKPQ